MLGLIQKVSFSSRIYGPHSSTTAGIIEVVHSFKSHKRQPPCLLEFCLNSNQGEAGPSLASFV